MNRLFDPFCWDSEKCLFAPNLQDSDNRPIYTKFQRFCEFHKHRTKIERTFWNYRLKLIHIVNCTNTTNYLKFDLTSKNTLWNYRLKHIHNVNRLFDPFCWDSEKCLFAPNLQDSDNRPIYTKFQRFCESHKHQPKICYTSTHHSKICLSPLFAPFCWDSEKVLICTKFAGF